MTSAPSQQVIQHLDSDDELFEQLEKDLESDSNLTHLREHRLEQLQHEISQAQEMKQNLHGTYLEILDEKELLKLTTSVHKCIVHFFKPDFRRCAIMDRHLEILSKKHFSTRFVRVNVDNSPFLVEKLRVQVLPCIISFINSISKDRLIGFEELGNTDDFPTSMLERRLINVGVINAVFNTNQQHHSIMQYPDGNNSSDDGD